MEDNVWLFLKLIIVFKIKTWDSVCLSMLCSNILIW